MAYTTINKSTDYFNTNLIPSASEITAVGHQADMIWLKSRTAGHSHEMIDTVRGISKKLKTDATSAESTDANIITAIGSDSYTVGSSSNSIYGGNNGVGWSWKANGTGSANTDGSINSTVSANTTSGFSIMTYTGNGSAGATIGHGLGAVPKMLIVKQLDIANNWKVYHVSMGNNNIMNLNDNSAQAGNTAFWNDTTPTPTLITLGTNGAINGSGATYVMYAFAEKPGYSKFGSYTGNGNIDGPFAYTGFKPNFIMLKNTVDSGDNWTIYDSSRDPNNKSENLLFANSNSTEADGNFMDILSNGFKQRNTSNGNNGNGDKLIYMAFGQSIVGSNNVPATAK